MDTKTKEIMSTTGKDISNLIDRYHKIKECIINKGNKIVIDEFESPNVVALFVIAKVSHLAKTNIDKLPMDSILEQETLTSLNRILKDISGILIVRDLPVNIINDFMFNILTVAKSFMLFSDNVSVDDIDREMIRTIEKLRSFTNLNMPIKPVEFKEN